MTMTMTMKTRASQLTRTEAAFADLIGRDLNRMQRAYSIAAAFDTPVAMYFDDGDMIYVQPQSRRTLEESL